MENNNNKKRYLTKFSRLTLSVGEEPDEYIKKRLDDGWSTGRIRVDLELIARQHGLDMVDRSTIISWIKANREDPTTS